MEPETIRRVLGSSRELSQSRGTRVSTSCLCSDLQLEVAGEGAAGGGQTGE